MKNNNNSNDRKTSKMKKKGKNELKFGLWEKWLEVLGFNQTLKLI